MKKMRSIPILSALFLLSCNFVSNMLNPVPTPADTGPTSNTYCWDYQPTQADIDHALQYNAEHFPAPDWETVHEVVQYWVMVTRANEKLAAMAAVNYATVCNVKQATLDQYYTDEIFDSIFEGYDSYEIQEACEANDLRLYEIKVQAKGLDYNGRLWVEVPDNDHIREFQLFFPASDAANLDAYSEKIMPELPSCK